MTDQAPIYVFVYGTLKRGLRNHHLLDQGQYIQESCTRHACWQIIDCPSWTHPGMRSPAVLEKGQYHIKGEIYKIDRGTLQILDDLEKINQHYKRQKIQLSDGPDSWMYINIVPDLEGDPQSTNIHVISDINGIMGCDIQSWSDQI